MPNYAYVTLITTNHFLPGVLVLNRTLKSTDTEIPLYCVVTSEVDEENRNILRSQGIQIIEKPEIPMPDRIRDYNWKHGAIYSGWFKAFSKFHVFGLEQFDKIVYLDADMFICQNLDHLFEKPHMTAATDSSDVNPWPHMLKKGDYYYRYFNSGMMVIKPSMNEFERLMNFVNNVYPDRVLADQNLLALFYPQWRFQKELYLPDVYNLLVGNIHKYEKLDSFEMKDVYIWHYVGKKPWAYSSRERGIWEISIDTHSQLLRMYCRVMEQELQNIGKTGFFEGKIAAK